MSVVLPNANLTVRAKPHQFARDAHGMPVAPSDATATATGPYPGAIKERPEQGGWNIRLAPEHWPVYEHDIITDGSRTWVVTNAQLHTVPGASDVDYIAVRAVLDPPRVL